MRRETVGLSSEAPVKPRLRVPVSPRAARLAASLALFGDVRQSDDALQEGLSGGGQFGAMGYAVEQLHADFRFQIPDLLTQGRLGDAHFLSRAGEVSLFGNGEKIADMAQFHAISFLYDVRLFHILDN